MIYGHLSYTARSQQTCSRLFAALKSAVVVAPWLPEPGCRVSNPAKAKFRAKNPLMLYQRR